MNVPLVVGLLAVSIVVGLLVNYALRGIGGGGLGASSPGIGGWSSHTDWERSYGPDGWFWEGDD